jgi:3-oxoacyl-[acyl-carrier protein] reductase
MRSDLEGRRVLVTGASGGIGSALARALVEEEAQPILHFNRGREAAARLAEELADPDGEAATTVQAELRSETSVEAMFAQLANQGPLHGLVVNAGVWPEEAVPLRRMELEQFRDTLEINLVGAFLCCRAFLRLVEETGVQDPAIVLVGSTAGLFGEEGHGDYSASKAALTGLTLTLKNEIVRIAERGRVNLVAPGWVATPMAEAALEDRAVVERVTSTMALRKVATPEDVAAAIVFFLSPRLAGHLSGAVLPVAGGMEGRILHPPSVG